MSSNENKVAVITGASAGIGKEAALKLLEQGWRVIGVGRNPERTKQAEADIRASINDPTQFEMLRCDLGCLADTQKLANTIASLTGRLDVLINNAGGLTSDLVITAEGNENTFASNHLGHFLLTLRLLPLLERTASETGSKARVINVSSNAHHSAQPFDFDNLQPTDPYNFGETYCRVKLANLLFTRTLAERVQDRGIVAHAMHPGVVSSNFANHGDERMQQYMASLDRDEPGVAADTLVWMSEDPELAKTTNGYFFNCAPEARNPMAEDDEAASKLWTVSEALVHAFLTN